VFAIELPHTFSINLQLLGGVWILQIFPMLVAGLYTRWFHRWALLAGWAAGMIYGTLAAYNVKNATTSHWAASSDIVFGHSIYIGITALIINVVIAVVLTVVLKAARVPEGVDETLPHQYTSDPEHRPAPTPAVVGAGAEG
jgi:solute:Na+ symporter, SSS family